MNALGLDLGGTQIKAVLVDETGAVLRHELRATGDADETAGSWAATMKALVEEMGRDLPVGISAPGLTSRNRRCIAHMPGRLRGLVGLDWTDYLGRVALVPVTNDAHASLRGEVWIGAARSLRDCFMLTLGTGVGGAVMSDGQILRGHLGRAGHLGHICLDMGGAPDIVGTPGSLEDLIGNHNIRERTEGCFESTHQLIAAAVGGDEWARAVWSKSVRALGCGIASLINVLDPEAVIIGGGIAEAGAALFTPLEEELTRVEWRPGGAAVRLLPAQLGQWAGAIGAAWEALMSETGSAGPHGTL